MYSKVRQMAVINKRAFCSIEHNEEQQQQDSNAIGNIPEEKIQAYINVCMDYVLTRLKALKETTKAEVLVVLDGPTPPIKEREVQRRTNKRREQEKVQGSRSLRQRDETVGQKKSPSKWEEGYQ